jgi:predicted kinase
MAKSSTRLVLICGLPASGKSPLARKLAPKVPAIRLDKDGWVTQLGADLWDEDFRVRLERQLWVLSQDLLARAERRRASGEWTASPMTRAHFERWATIFQPPDEEEILLFDKPVAEGCSRRTFLARYRRRETASAPR